MIGDKWPFGGQTRREAENDAIADLVKVVAAKLDEPCPGRYTDQWGMVHACSLMHGHQEPHHEAGEGKDFMWAHWASDKPGVKPYRGCEEEVENPDGRNDVWLDCELEHGHAGLHHDGTIDVDWVKS